MSFNGSGIFTRVYSWVLDAGNGIDILAARMDAEDDGFATGLSNCLTRDGQSPPLTNIPMGGFKITDLAPGSMSGDAVAFQQISGPGGSGGIGFIQPSASAVPRTLSGKLGEIAVSIVDFGAVADSTSYTTGTNNAAAIQNAIRYVYSKGGGVVLVPGVAQSDPDLALPSRIAYGWNSAVGPLIIPSNVRVVGNGPLGSVLRRIDNGSALPGISVGTFGPSNGPPAVLASCPKYTINDITASAGPLLSSVTCTTASDAANFAVGDIIGIEGSQNQFGEIGQFLPNLAARVTSANTSTGVITLDHAIDDGDGFGYVTTGGVRPGIRRLRNDAVAAITDCTGQTWPLACAVRAGIENLGIDMPVLGGLTGWGTPNLSTYDCQFRDLEINAFYIAGNPIAYCLFERVHLNYYGMCTEFAFLSHDTLWVDCTYSRHAAGIGKVQGAPNIWINQGEGGKRVHFLRCKMTDRADVTGSVAVQALGLRAGSSWRNGDIVIPKGNAGYTQGNCIIADSNIRVDATAFGSTAGLSVAAGVVERCVIRAPGVTLGALVVGGTGRPDSNVIGDQSGGASTLLATDCVVLNDTAARRSGARGNITAYSAGSTKLVEVVNTVSSPNTVTSFILLDAPSATFNRLVGLDFRVTVDAMIGWTGTAFNIVLGGYGAITPLAQLTLTGLPINTAGHLTINYQHHEPGSQSAAYEIVLQTSTTRYVAVSNIGNSGGISGQSLVGFNLTITGMTVGDIVAINSGRMDHEPTGAVL